MGDEITVDLVGTDFPTNAADGGPLDGGGIDVEFDPTVVNAKSVTVNTALFEFFSAPGVIDNTAGTITGIQFVTFKAVTPDEPLFATIVFDAVEVGVSSLALSENIDLGGFVAGGQKLDVTFDQDGSINVAVIPLPAAFWLLLPALGFLAGWRRKAVAAN